MTADTRNRYAAVQEMDSVFVYESGLTFLEKTAITFQLRFFIFPSAVLLPLYVYLQHHAIATCRL